MTQWGLDTLFNPAKRHMDEEKRRLQTTREQLGDSSGGKRIDLESGKVVIRRASEDGVEDEAHDGVEHDVVEQGVDGDETVDQSVDGDETVAQSVDSTASVSDPGDSPQIGDDAASRDAQ